MQMVKFGNICQAPQSDDSFVKSTCCKLMLNNDGLLVWIIANVRKRNSFIHVSRAQYKNNYVIL